MVVVDVAAPGADRAAKTPPAAGLVTRKPSEADDGLPIQDHLPVFGEPPQFEVEPPPEPGIPGQVAAVDPAVGGDDEGVPADRAKAGPPGLPLDRGVDRLDPEAGGEGPGPAKGPRELVGVRRLEGAARVRSLTVSGSKFMTAG